MEPQSPNDPAQADIAWEGYHPRALMPVAVALAVVSLVMWTGRWYWEDLSAFADRVGTLALFALSWCVWPVFAVVFLYRTITFSYRLTDRALHVDFGFRARPVPALWLKDVIRVRAGAGFWGRLLNTGWIEVSTATQTVRLRGVHAAPQFAARIREAITTAQSC